MEIAKRIQKTGSEKIKTIKDYSLGAEMIICDCANIR